ncbi:endoplasmic reticulum junction formation protein lunapark-A-like [Daphnia carinata]|uniref:endoplasmic reticulum junction formation protein lunapark-A-like n=1 Tax=Daphnia carinata TaxID=120202 RepID=UPI00257B93BF|nr:endoplasmic reticulum junction formation protein lunapark-A-like [Daphnia carinata]
MGILLSRFRHKPSTKEILEDIDKELKSIDEFQQDTIERQKRVVRQLLVIFILVYVVAIASFFFITSVQKYKLYYFTGLVTFALITWSSHRGVKWYFNRRMVRKSEKSVELRKKKKKILEHVMDTETYKIAKEILDKFGDKPQNTPFEVKPAQTPAMNARPSAPGTELRHRHVEQQQALPLKASGTLQQNKSAIVGSANKMNQQLNKPQMQQSMLSTQRPVAMNYGHAPLRPLPRPILPRERGVLDRMMDLFVGDGPHQRYALICRHCSGHNGMALQEEFEFVSYYCCYCYQFNPPRKTRPVGPRLPVPPSPVPFITTSEASLEAKLYERKENQEKPCKVEQERSEKDEDVSENSDGNTSEDTLSDEESEAAESDAASVNKIQLSDGASEAMDVDIPEGDKAILDDAGQDASSLR